MITFNEVSFRIGGLIIHNLNETFRLEAFGAIQLNNFRPTNSFTVYEFIANFNKLELHAGVFGTPNTVSFRPNPLTWRSQTELYTETRFIGGRPGFKAEYEITNDFHIVYAFMNHRGTWAHHVKLKYKGLYLGGYLEDGEDYFVSAKLGLGNFEFISNYSSIEEEFAAALFFRPEGNYTFYSDFNLFKENYTNKVSRIGIRRHFAKENWKLKGFLALEYDIAPNVLTGHVFINLN